MASATNVWAAGSYYNGSEYRTLIAIGYYGKGVTSQSLAERWNGRAWRRISSPSPSGIFGTTLLNGIAAASATSAWAVGYYKGSVSRTLILRWNGRAWKRVPSPNR